VLNFADTSHLDVPMTSDLGELERGIGRVDSIGGTALRDAVKTAGEYLHDHARWDRRVLMVITDGNDNTARTGGVAYFPASVEQIDSVVVNLARQIRSQYTIAYAPLNQSFDGSYRTIRVTASGPERFAVRTRSGYRAVPGTLDGQGNGPNHD